ncbi:MAG: NusG domain II-containing protein [Christensenellales bacterium]
MTLAPDAVEYLDETPAPEVTAEPQPTEAPEITAEPQPTEAPEITAEPTAAPESANMVGPVMPKQTDKVRGYVVITVAGRQYGDPIPMDRDKIITIKQDNGEINKIHITPEYVVMESSTCENQDCIGEGEVNVNTYKDRILSTYIICLPNQVTIEMVPADE